ncbi:MAG: tRNA-specific adenosine deaminase [Acidimicrobiaceae bacterium TMED130]|nr:MAG: tRNA-specific adenosine deaminase [Acidimicrobiaceae bacterium TMED130]|tara:strand:+ start:8122 stop:8571 length:450 start_codon:yes stop_codon:yes gene_type:complete
MNDEEMMRMAIAEARLAEEHGDIPIGAIVVLNDEVLSSRHNERELQNDPTAHAEMLAIRDAAKALGTSRLDGAILVSTLEPCPMCAGAALLARVSRVIFGAEDPKAGALGSLYQLGSDPRLNHEFMVTPRVLQEECGRLLQKFFQSKRD